MGGGEGQGESLFWLPERAHLGGSIWVSSMLPLYKSERLNFLKGNYSYLFEYLLCVTSNGWILYISLVHCDKNILK